MVASVAHVQAVELLLIILSSWGSIQTPIGGKLTIFQIMAVEPMPMLVAEDK